MDLEEEGMEEHIEEEDIVMWGGNPFRAEPHIAHEEVEEIEEVEEDNPVNAFLNPPAPRGGAWRRQLMEQYQNELARALEQQRRQMIQRGDPNPWNMNGQQANPFDPQNPNPWMANPYRDPPNANQPNPPNPQDAQNPLMPGPLNPPIPPNPVLPPMPAPAPNPRNNRNQGEPNLWVHRHPVPFLLLNPQELNPPNPRIREAPDPINPWNELDPAVLERLQREHEERVILHEERQDEEERQRRRDLHFQWIHDRLLRQHERDDRAREQRRVGRHPIHREWLEMGEPFRFFGEEDMEMEMEVEQQRPLRKYPLGSGYPVVSEIVFDKRNNVPQQSVGAHGELDWIVRWSAHHYSPGILAGQCVIAFNGMGNNAYKIYITHESNQPRLEISETDDMVVVDKDHYQIMFPYTLMAAVDNSTDGRYLVPDVTLTLTVHNIEKLDTYTPKDHLWPHGTEWLTYKDFYSIRFDKQAAIERNPHFERILDEMRRGILSEKEALALYDILCLIFHRSFYGTEKYHEVMLNGFKMGFTEGWDRQDLPDTALDFHSRTMLPMYQILTEEDPIEQVHREEPQCGACDIFRLKLNPNILYRRSQMEPMIPIRGHKGQYTIYLEETNHGLLLLVAVSMQVVVRQQAKMKISLFENGLATIRYIYYRIIDKEQKTIKAVVAVLNPVQRQLMIEGKLSLNIQLHVANTEATFIHNYQADMDVDTPYLMPGVINGWLVCQDGKKIGVCKEHVAHHSLWLEQLFFNTAFADCGKDTINVSADSEIVMDLLNIIYHRCHAVHLNKLQDVMELARYWLSPIGTRYVDMAVLRSPLLSKVDKVKLAVLNDLEVCKYIFRHPEYHTTYNLGLPASAVVQLNAIKHCNELDSGEKGRQEVVAPDPMEEDPNVPGPAPPAAVPAPEIAAPAP